MRTSGPESSILNLRGLHSEQNVWPAVTTAEYEAAARAIKNGDFSVLMMLMRGRSPVDLSKEDLADQLLQLAADRLIADAEADLTPEAERLTFLIGDNRLHPLDVIKEHKTGRLHIVKRPQLKIHYKPGFAPQVIHSESVCGTTIDGQMNHESVKFRDIRNSIKCEKCSQINPTGWPEQKSERPLFGTTNTYRTKVTEHVKQQLMRDGEIFAADAENAVPHIKIMLRKELLVYFLRHLKAFDGDIKSNLSNYERLVGSDLVHALTIPGLRFEKDQRVFRDLNVEDIHNSKLPLTDAACVAISLACAARILSCTK